MKVILALTFLLVSVINGKPVLEDEIELPEIKKLSFRIEDIASEEKLKEFTGVLNDLKENNTKVNDIDVDELLDGILVKLKDIIIRNGYDPMALDDTTLKLVPTGTIKLTSGWLQDTSSINRYDNVVVTYSAKKYTFLLPLSFKALLFTYKYKTKVLLLSIDGDVQGKIDNVKLNLEIGYDPETQTLFMGTSSLKDSGKITVKFTGNGLVDWITNAMTSVVTTVLYPILIRIIEGFIDSAGSDLVDAVNDYIHG